MDGRRISPNNPALAGVLRYQNRSAAYGRRPLHPTTISDMQAVSRPRPTGQRSLKAQPKLVASQAIRRQNNIAPVQPHPPLTQQSAQSPTLRFTKPQAATKQPDIKQSSTIKTSQAQVDPAVQPELAYGTRQKQTDNSIAPAQPMAKGWWPRKPGKQSLLYAMAGFVFIAGVLVSVNGMQANKQVAAQVKLIQQPVPASTGQPANKPVAATTRPSGTASHAVVFAPGPTEPKYIDIPALKVHARALSEGLTGKGALDVPWDIADTGWYNASAHPGVNRGAVLIDGHSGIGKLHGVFHDIAQLTAGANIVITRGDNTKVTYSVVKVQTVNVNNVDMSSMVVSADPSKQGLNLITCAGDQIPGTTELNERVQVYAVMQ